MDATTTQPPAPQPGVRHVNTHRKGSRWRRAVQDWLGHNGWATRFRGLGEAGDDITASRAGLALSVECKDHQRFDLAGWVDQAERQAPVDAIPIVIAHRRGHASVNGAYVVMSGRAFARLMTGE